MTWKRPLLRPAALAMFVFMGLGLRISHADNRDAIERWELQCQEARAHIAQCCQVSTNINCKYSSADVKVDEDKLEDPEPGCDIYEHWELTPDLQEAQARCIRKATCDELSEAGICAIVKQGLRHSDQPTMCGAL